MKSRKAGRVKGSITGVAKRPAKDAGTALSLNISAGCVSAVHLSPNCTMYNSLAIRILNWSTF